MLGDFVQQIDIAHDEVRLGHDADLKAAGYNATVRSLVVGRAEQARRLGVDGLVCSAEEAVEVRAVVGGKLALVAPGIRPAGSDPGEQKRIATPAAGCSRPV